MRKLNLLILTLLSSISIFAQAPQKMSYQAVIRNNSDALITNTLVGMKISLLQGSASGIIVYAETHAPLSNINGLISVEIGSGTILNGNFSSIDWGNGPYFLKSETDPTGGANYSISGISQFLSVPYALYAENSGNPGPQGIQGLPGTNGIDGLDGLTGPQGIQGLPGTNGLVGATGPIGLIGPTGLTGPQGLPGTNGTNGVAGAIGLTGPQGVQGLPGTNGSVGATGPTGLTGPQGLPGTNGTNGIAGAIGLTGAIGAIGAIGPQGVQGLTGANGAVGAIGPIGLTGAAGATGPQGIQGLPGTNGATGPIGLTGTQGIQGLPGMNGTNGVAGAIGLTGATGPQGLMGATGAVGAIGPIGLTGVAGATGPQGVQGLPGTDGAAGATGPAGVVGSFPNGSIIGDMQYWNGTIWEMIPIGSNGQTLTICNGVPFWGPCPAVLPTVSTLVLNGISNVSASGGGTVIYDGGSLVTERGICWSTLPNPTISNNFTINGNGLGSYISSLTSLNPSTTYYIRAYATNGLGTAYGNQLIITTNAIPLVIGMSYEGGKIAYIDGSGQHGLIAAPNDQSSGIFWHGTNSGITGAIGLSIGTGNVNTNSIITFYGTENNAARICYDLVLNGYSDWYLPSLNELNQLYINRIQIGGFSTIGYWSSTESDSGNAWVQGFSSFLQAGNNKTNFNPVRAIRTF